MDQEATPQILKTLRLPATVLEQHQLASVEILVLHKQVMETVAPQPLRARPDRQAGLA
jgi:hypothetical protein